MSETDMALAREAEEEARIAAEVKVKQMLVQLNKLDLLKPQLQKQKRKQMQPQKLSKETN